MVSTFRTFTGWFKNATPKTIAFLATIVIVAAITLFLTVLYLCNRALIHPVSIGITALLSFLITYATSYFFLQNFLYRKIKAIYKIIYEQKSSAKSKPSDIRMDTDIIVKLRKKRLNG